MGWFDSLFGAKPVKPELPPEDPADSILLFSYPDQTPFLYGAVVAHADGGPDPLDAVSIYWNEAGPHWHYIGRGLSPAGIELTFRLAARPEDVGTEPDQFLGSIAYQAPTWPILLLNMLARRVLRTQRPFAVGHWWEGQDGVLRPHAGFTRLAFASDSSIGQLNVDGTRVQYLQAIAITEDELIAMQEDEREGRGDVALDALTAMIPVITDLARFP